MGLLEFIAFVGFMELYSKRNKHKKLEKRNNPLSTTLCK
jgi:hypothetical protein